MGEFWGNFCLVGRSSWNSREKKNQPVLEKNKAKQKAKQTNKQKNKQFFLSYWCI